MKTFTRNSRPFTSRRREGDLRGQDFDTALSRAIIATFGTWKPNGIEGRLIIGTSVIVNRPKFRQILGIELNEKSKNRQSEIRTVKQVHEIFKRVTNRNAQTSKEVIKSSKGV
jgi:hypothetical protein